MKKFTKYLKSLPSKAASFYSKAKAFIEKLIPQELKDELNFKGGVTVFVECVTFVALLVISYISLCFISVLV